MSIADIQMEEARRLQEDNANAEKMGKTSGSAWGSSAGSSQSSGATLAEIQAEEARKAEALRVHQEASASSRMQQESAALQGSQNQLKSLLGVAGGRKAPAGGWGKRDEQKVKSSLLDIIQEESQTAQSDPTPRIAPNSWAAKAAAGAPPSSWGSSSSGSIAPPPQLAVPPTPPQMQTISAPAKKSATTTAAAAVTTTRTPSAPQQQQQTGQGKGKDNFGVSVSAEFEEWCLTQLRKINDSDDLDLIHFCMSLTSAVEIREYFASYLGSTPQVSQFASEFIKRKDALSGAQRDSSTVSVKKKK